MQKYVYKKRNKGSQTEKESYYYFISKSCNVCHSENKIAFGLHLVWAKAVTTQMELIVESLSDNRT